MVLPDLTNIVDVLAWIGMGSGAATIVTYLLALVVENWAEWHNFPKWVKFLSPMAASILLTVTANVLLRQSELITQVQPWWSMIIVSALAWLGSQKALMDARAAGYAVGARMQAVDNATKKAEEKEADNVKG